MTAATATTLPPSLSPSGSVALGFGTDAQFATQSPVLLTSNVATVDGQLQLQLLFEGTVLQSTDRITVDTSLADVVMQISPPTGYTLEGSDRECDGVTPPQWIPIEGGAILADFTTPATVDTTNRWKFTISATPNGSQPPVEPADPIMVIKKVR